MPSTATSILDGLSTSVAVKAPCRTVATTNITLAGLQTISGYTTVENDRVLVKGQTNAVDNGIYMASTGSWTRAKDADGNRDLVQGTRVIVRSSSITGVEYELTTANPIVIGTTALVFELRYGANAVYDQTEAEIAAGVTITNDAIPSHNVGGIVRPERYGFSTAATAAVNVAALQAAVDVVEEATTLKLYLSDGYGANTYTQPELHLPEGEISINADVVLPPSIIIRGNKTMLVQTSASEDHFSCANPYRIDIEGIAFRGGRSAFRASGSNTNTSRIRIARCELHTGNSSNYAISVSVQTLNMLIENCSVLNSPLFLDTDGDYVEINSCWVNGYDMTTGLKPASTASVNNRSRYMRVRGGSWVPEEQGAGVNANTRWFNNRGGMLVLEDVQFGAENAGLPIVYEFGSSVNASSPFFSQNGVIIRGCQIAQGTFSRADRGVVVLQEVVPSVIDIRASNYVVDGAIVSDAGFTSVTLADWLTANIASNTPRFGITIESVGEHGSTFVPSALLPYARITKRSVGTHPGYNNLGPINEPIVEYFPHSGGIQSRIIGNVSGRKSDPASTTYFDAITVSKTVNAAVGSAAAVVEIDAIAVGEVAGPLGFVSQAKFRITLLSHRSGNILSTVETVTQNNKDSSGGTSVGNVLQCQVTGTSTTTVTIQLRINTTIAAGSATVTWSGRMVSGANLNAGDTGRVFTMVSL